jgi:putative holliday junction resolvase
MNGRTFLAFDFGEKRIGIAIGNDLIESARGLTTITCVSDSERFSAISTLVDEWQPFAFVVGHPTHPDGTPHAMTARAEKFARQLEGRFHRKSVLVDERYSSVDAERAIRSRGEKLSKSNLDTEAAAEILQRFFDSGTHHSLREEPLHS